MLTPAEQSPAQPAPEHFAPNENEPQADIDSPIDRTPPAGPAPRRRGATVAIVLLSVVLVATITALVFLAVWLNEANALIDEQHREIEQQENLIDKKETFRGAMQELLSTVGEFEGVQLSTIIPFDRYDTIAAAAWEQRRSPRAVDVQVRQVQTLTSDLQQMLAVARDEAASNTTGTIGEGIIDRLGGGFVSSQVTDVVTLCSNADAVACVRGQDPTVVYFDSAADSAPSTNDWIRTGIAYHEYAHVLQFTNPEATDIALDAFGQDHEIMADCFALVYLDGWTLDHRVWANSYSYWDVEIGYGHVCDEPQRAAVRQWYDALGVKLRPVTQ